MITLYTAATPNGHKASVTLEELQIPYQTQVLSLSNNEQKTPAFLAINPNGRIPAIVDSSNDNFAVFESAAIMIYLAEKQPTPLWPEDPKRRSQVLQWLMFQMAGVGPMMGQAGWFLRAEEKVPLAIERYKNESLRLLTVLDTQLAQQEFLVGDYSLADIANFCWARATDYLQLDISHLKNLQRWLATIAQRPAVVRGLEVGQ